MGKSKKKNRVNKANTSQKHTQKSSSNIWLAVVMIMVIGGYSVLISVNSLNEERQDPIPEDQKTVEEIAADAKFLEETMVIRDTDYKIGPDNASVKLIEYSDYECPYCAIFDETLKDILAEFPNDIQLIYRDFPLTSIHKNAVPASKAAYAAAQQGKFWEMHDIILADQSDWNRLTGNDLTEKFESYATELGLEMKFFVDDYENADEFVENSRTESFQLGLTGTPSLFVNGKKTDLPSNIESFKQIIKNEIK